RDARPRGRVGIGRLLEGHAGSWRAEGKYRASRSENSPSAAAGAVAVFNANLGRFRGVRKQPHWSAATRPTPSIAANAGRGGFSGCDAQEISAWRGGGFVSVDAGSEQSV